MSQRIADASAKVARSSYPLRQPGASGRSPRRFSDRFQRDTLWSTRTRKSA